MVASPEEVAITPAKDPSRHVRRIRQDRQPARKYGFACANCRRRKARCVGNLPTCDRCLANNETCYLDKVPSVAYALTLQDRVKSFEAMLSDLKEAGDKDRLRLLEEYFGKGPTTTSKPPRASLANVCQQKDSPQSEASVEDEVNELLNEASVDEEGRMCFYGKTSLYHFQPEEIMFTYHPDAAGALIGSIPYEPGVYKGNFEDSPSPSALSQHSELGSIINSEISQALVNELLDTYWSLPHHLHLVVCRKIFMRDVECSGPYVNIFLLNSVLSQAARFSDRSDAPKISDYFAKKALTSLGDAIGKGSSIPTLQGLLIFSARECASGRTSQGWLYSGMAFRMMHDLGIHIYPKSLSHLVGRFSPEDLAVRQQVFWSCYTWDKTMSLCLGRAPIIHDVQPVPDADTWPDGDDAENELWRPRYSSSSKLDVAICQKSRMNSRFSAYCKLCIIIDNILDTLYSRLHTSGDYPSSYMDQTMQKLEGWANDLPADLYVDASARTALCPPLHVLLLNLLYHATIILLCRPHRPKSERARALATNAAEMIDGLITLHVKRFGFRVMTYLEMYTVFVGATINILDFKERDGPEAEAASIRLAFNLEVLRNARSTPSTLRCVEIIQHLLKQKRLETGNNTCRQSTSPRERVPSTQVTSQIATIPSNLTLNPTFRGTIAESDTTVFRADTMNRVRSDDLSLLSTVNSSAFPDIPSRQDPGSQSLPHFHACDFSSGISSMQLNAGSPVQAPLRWLLDNVYDDCGCMMMGMDFAGSLGSASAGHDNA
ncbi:transcriptional regulator family: Fungal Specific TF [Paecilomyces variotii]|nr:transcriptional regulator family: Fungal Specific TF [Paecilomyces variotii]KAJ9276208.1 transcriptional regulator family: Fungal Specific TF [Paecilomyces variotii]KAJ9340846.1 transcriptional regulator family: Fungal Specific TF [Paecilomyces variotii]KAJ9392168.1 transcriptional regulator family: Fungal Specific TF [Paecilomyces variotii]